MTYLLVLMCLSGMAILIGLIGMILGAVKAVVLLSWGWYVLFPVSIVFAVTGEFRHAIRMLDKDYKREYMAKRIAKYEKADEIKDMAGVKIDGE